MIATAVSTGVSVYSSQKQSQAAQAAADYQAKVGEQNARDVEYAGAQERQRLNLQKAQTIGTGRAAWGGSGVALGSGSPVDWEVDVDERARADVRTSKYNSAVKAYNYRANASLAEYQGNQAVSAGLTGSTQSLLSGAGTVSRSYYKYKYGS